MKNCEPFVFGPALAMASLPGLSKRCDEFLVSSSNLYPGPPNASPLRVAPLNHEIGNHAMEDSSVVERILALGSGRGMGPLPLAFGKLGEVGHGVGGVFFEKAANDGPSVVCKRA